MECSRPKLSKREQQCLYFASCDLSTRETAEKMHLGFETVKSYRRMVLQKLNCKTMVGAVVLATEMKIFDVN